MNKVFNRINKIYRSHLNGRKYKPVLQKNLELKNKFAGKRCFIIGNGPSIENQDLVRLANEETFVVNTFWFHPKYLAINPKNYFFLDAGSKAGPFFFTDDIVKREKELMRCRTRLFFNLKGFYEQNMKNNLFSKNETYYLMLDGYFTENMKFNIDIDQPIPQVKNVIIACIMSAVYMGFHEIYLLGCEHDFLAHSEQFQEKHAFGTYFVEPKDDEERKYYGMHIRSYEEQIDQIKILFRNYRLLKQKISRLYPEVRIYNATPNSFLDVFPKVDFEQVLAGLKKPR